MNKEEEFSLELAPGDEEYSSTLTHNTKVLDLELIPVDEVSLELTQDIKEFNLELTPVTKEFSLELNHDNKEVVKVIVHECQKDSGYAWVIVVASFIMQACSFGVISGFGVFLEHYLSIRFQGQPSSQIALIGTLAPSTAALASFFTGRICDLLGVRICTITGGILISLSFLLASISTEIWQFIATQGFLFGLGSSLVYIPANVILTQWFDKYRGLATGIGTAGSGFGGLGFNLMNSHLLTKVGLVWTLRINGIVLGALLLISSLIIRTQTSTQSKDTRSTFEISMVFNFRFGLFACGMLFASFSFLIPLYYLPSYATSYGLTKQEGALLVALVNVSSAAGRLLNGAVSDHLGHLNSFILSILFSALMLIIWAFSTSFPILVVFAIFYGLPSGGFASGFPSTCYELFGQDNIGTLMGIAYAPTGFGDLLGPSISGAILDSSKDYKFIIIFAICLFGMSSLCNLLIRIFFMPKSFIQRRLVLMRLNKK